MKISNFATYIATLSMFFTANAAPVEPNKKQNIILMVSDGMGVATLDLARQYNAVVNGLELPSLLNLDDYLIGSLRTRSNSSFITDSAAAGTALACGKKSYNKAIGVDPDRNPIGNVGEALKIEGYTVGIVVTTKITDATPGVFYAHSDSRSYEDLIAEQLVGEHPLGRIPDLVMGGGRTYFYPNTSEGGSRADSRNLIEEIQNNGTWSYAGNRQEFDELDGGNNVTLPLLGLFADKDIPYKIDRNESVYPSLNEQVQVALTALTEATKDSEKGFFLMIEGSRIDHAGHANDAAASVRETIEYDSAWKEVLDFADASEVETLVVSISDHETGGISLNAEKAEDYQPLINATHSGEYLSKEINNFSDIDDDALFTKFIKSEIIEKGLGIYNYTNEEIERVKNTKNNEEPEYTEVLANLTSSRAKIRFSSYEHTAVDVGVYAHSNSDRLQYKVLNRINGLAGAHENTDYPKFLQGIVGFDMDDVTELIQDIQHTLD